MRLVIKFFCDYINNAYNFKVVRITKEGELMKINFQSVLNLSKPSMLKNDTKVNYTPNVAFAPIKDSVSFSARGVREINVDEKTAEIVANSLSTSTSGHRATYGSDLFNKDIVELLTVGVGNYAKNKASERGTIPRVVIGGDTRVASRESLPLIKGILSGIGVDVEYITDPVPTPVLALYTQQRDPDIAILLTASHNPWEDGGYNLVTSDGAIAPPEVTKQVANEVVKAAKKGYYLLKTPENKGQIAHVRPYESYKEKIENLDLIDFDNIQDADIKIYYDDLKGTGASTFEKILRDYEIPYSHVYSGKKTGPNPTSTNLQELKDAVKNDQNRMRIGLSNDGDADRFGVID